MVERILELLKVKNLTPSQFADEIGIQRSGMSHLISGRNKPSLEFVMKVLNRFPDVKPGYLLYGINSEGGVKNEEVTDDMEIRQPISGTLFDQPLPVETKPEPKQARQVKKERAERKIERIVVFYEDKTFREYEPE